MRLDSSASLVLEPNWELSHDVHGSLVEIVAGEKCGRETDGESAYFNAVCLAHLGADFAPAMCEWARDAGVGRSLGNWKTIIFQLKQLKEWIRI